MEDEFYIPLKNTSTATQYSLIASQIANTDELVSKIRDQAAEVVKLKVKMRSLKDSAMHVKGLYEIKCCENKQLELKINELQDNIQFYKMQCFELEHTKVNSELSYKQAFAEFENKYTSNAEYCVDIVQELIGKCKDSLKLTPMDTELSSTLDKILSTLTNYKQNFNSTEKLALGKRKKKAAYTEKNCVSENQVSTSSPSIELNSQDISSSSKKIIKPTTKSTKTQTEPEIPKVFLALFIQ